MMIEKVFLAVHVVAGVVFVGPVALTSSLFPRFVPRAAPGRARSALIDLASVSP